MINLKKSNNTEEKNSVDWGHWVTDKLEIPEDAFGFVYKITDLTNDCFYIGIKQLYKQVRLKPLKGKKRKRLVKKDSDWRTYTSSGVIKEDIENKKQNYKLEILSFHNSKSELKIEETRLIIDNIYNPKCYNECVNIRCRIQKSINKNV